MGNTRIRCQRPAWSPSRCIGDGCPLVASLTGSVLRVALRRMGEGSWKRRTLRRTGLVLSSGSGLLAASRAAPVEWAVPRLGEGTVK